MAVTATQLGSVLQVVVQTGTNTNGDPVLRTRSYQKVTFEATDTDVNDVGAALAGLQTYPMHAIHRVNEIDLVSA